MKLAGLVALIFGIAIAGWGAFIYPDRTARPLSADDLARVEADIALAEYAPDRAVEAERQLREHELSQVPDPARQATKLQATLLGAALAIAGAIMASAGHLSRRPPKAS